MISSERDESARSCGQRLHLFLCEFDRYDSSRRKVKASIDDQGRVEALKGDSSFNGQVAVDDDRSGARSDNDDGCLDGGDGDPLAIHAGEAGGGRG